MLGCLSLGKSPALAVYSHATPSLLLRFADSPTLTVIVYHVLNYYSNPKSHSPWWKTRATRSRAWLVVLELTGNRDENQPNTMFVFVATLLYTTLDLTERCSHHLYLEKRSLWFMDLGKSLYN